MEYYMVDRNLEALNLQPEPIWRFFFDITKIPRCSGNESEIREYIKKFCIRRNLKYAIDKVGNVVVYKTGRDNSKETGIIFQSHMDMVCEKNSDSLHDFSKDPIEIEIVDGWVKAKQTTLGADNGIGVAVMLALLDSDTDYGYSCVFTVEEEVGLRGAFQLDTDLVKGNYLVNLDTEREGVIYIGCAGGRDSDMLIPVSSVPFEIESTVLKIHMHGFKGGHSGAEIHLGRENAIRVMARVLYRLSRVVTFRIVDISGGDKHNAIPRECICSISINKSSTQLVKELVSHYFNMIKSELDGFEDSIGITIHDEKSPNATLDYASTIKLINFILSLPHGILRMSPEFPEIVQSSTNISSIRKEGGGIRIHASHRSSSDSALQWIADSHRAIAELAGAVINQDAGYPGWKENPSSKLVSVVKKAIENVTGKKAMVRVIHAGLECGILKRRINGVEAISIGPTIVGAHSPDERVDVKSVEVLWKIINEILSACAESC